MHDSFILYFASICGLHTTNEEKQNNGIESLYREELRKEIQ